MTWNHRVVEENGGFSIREVYYNKAGKECACSLCPVPLWEDSKKELRQTIKRFKKALKHPVLKIDNIKWAEL